MTVWNAVLLGLVQGIAGFLPISGSGHIAMFNNLFKLSSLSEGHRLFQVFLHLAMAAAVCIVYWPELAAMYLELSGMAGFGPLAGREKPRYPGARCFLMIVLATLPLLLGLPVRGMIAALEGENILIGVMLIFTGFLLYVSDRMKPGKKTESSMSISDALIIGLCQCTAVIPGLSRMGVAASAGIATGLRPDFAINFSFLLALPSSLGAAILAIIDASADGVDWGSVPAYLIGTAAALLSGVAAIHLMRYIGRRFKLGSFAYYCWVVGVLSIVLHLIF